MDIIEAHPMADQMVLERSSLAPQFWYIQWGYGVEGI